MEDHKPQLGEWCEIGGTLLKSRSGNYVRWTRLALPTCEKAMYVGWRVVHEGEVVHETEYIDGQLWSTSREFKHSKSLYVWLFVRNEREKPFYVLAKDVRRTITSR